VENSLSAFKLIYDVRQQHPGGASPGPHGIRVDVICPEGRHDHPDAALAFFDNACGMSAQEAQGFWRWKEGGAEQEAAMDVEPAMARFLCTNVYNTYGLGAKNAIANLCQRCDVYTRSYGLDGREAEVVHTAWDCGEILRKAHESTASHSRAAEWQLPRQVCVRLCALVCVSSARRPRLVCQVWRQAGMEPPWATAGRPDAPSSMGCVMGTISKTWHVCQHCKPPNPCTIGVLDLVGAVYGVLRC
jgi:hypothetical protein